MIGAALFVFTVITVAANQVHLAVPVAITVGAHHRDHQGVDGGRGVHAPEPREAVDLRFAAPDRRVLHRADARADPDDIRHHRHADSPAERDSHGAAARSTKGTEMSLRAFHLLFIALSVMLAAFVAAWAVGQYRSRARIVYAVTAVARAGGRRVARRVRVLFQRKTRNL